MYIIVFYMNFITESIIGELAWKKYSSFPDYIY